LLLHIVDAAPLEAGADPARDARSIVAELKKFDTALYRKPRWLVLNKMDMLPAEERKAAAADIVRRLRWRGPSFCISALNGEGCRELGFAAMKFLESGMTA
jgi:GTP-binding protein